MVGVAYVVFFIKGGGRTENMLIIVTESAFFCIFIAELWLLLTKASKLDLCKTTL